MTDKKELAEQILEKYFPHEYGEPFSYYERKSITAAIIEAMSLTDTQEIAKVLHWVRRNYEIDFAEGNHWHDCLDDEETPISDKELAELYLKEKQIDESPTNKEDVASDRVEAMSINSENVYTKNPCDENVNMSDTRNDAQRYTAD